MVNVLLDSKLDLLFLMALLMLLASQSVAMEKRLILRNAMMATRRMGMGVALHALLRITGIALAVVHWVPANAKHQFQLLQKFK